MYGLVNLLLKDLQWQLLSQRRQISRLFLQDNYCNQETLVQSLDLTIIYTCLLFRFTIMFKKLEVPESY